MIFGPLISAGNSRLTAADAPLRDFLPRNRRRTLPQEPASYLGVYETGPPGTYQPVTAFTQMAGEQPNLVGYYSGWREAFPTSFAMTVHRHGAVTIMQWDPTLTSVSKMPILLSETAVGPQAGQATKIPELFAGMRHYGTLGLVWFDIAKHGGTYSQDWHIGDNPAAETAFQRGVAALTLAKPL